MTVNLPAPPSNMKALLDNLRAARQEVGSGAGTGETLLKINDHTGEATYGAEKAPMPEGMRWAVALQSFRYGYIDWQDGKPSERNIIPMMEGAKPIPKGGSTTKDLDPQGKVLGIRTLKPGEYGNYGGGGPQDVCEIILTSLDEPGFHLLMPASKSSANRVGNLLEEAIAHSDTAAGRAGFVHPVIEFKTDKYKSERFKRDVHHFNYKILDWLHTDGSTLLSQHGGVLEAQPANGEDAPWDDDSDLTDEERELLKAG